MMATRSRDFSVQDISLRVFNWRNLYKIDWLLPLCVLGLAIMGWAILYSASRSSDASYMYMQMTGFAAGLLIAMLIICIDYRFLISLAPLMYIIGIGLLAAVLLSGYTAKGAERWLALGPIRIQPSEMFKLIMVYMLAWYFTALGKRIQKLHWFIFTFIVVGIPIVLILRQPNLGTAACLIPLTFGMLYVAGCRFWHLAVVILLGATLIPVLWWQMHDFDPDAEPSAQQSSSIGLKHYQKKRIYTFLNPNYDPQGSGWHTYQSKITIGSGGMSGKGYLQGTQTRLSYLPEHHTDFIFSLLAEEFGFVGGAVVLGLFLAFLLRGLMYARDCPDMTGTLLATGVVIVLAYHIFVNIAITMGLMPVTGIPLPFLSFGRSFYLTTMAMVGVLLNVPMRRRVFVY